MGVCRSLRGFPNGASGKEPAYQCRRCKETWAQSLGPLEEGMATHSSIPAWRIPWTVARRAPLFMGCQRIRHDCVTNATDIYRYYQMLAVFLVLYSISL